MKTKLTIILLTIWCGVGFAQKVDFDLISYDGLPFYSTKAEIVKALGKPNEIYKPNYACGLLSSDWQDTKYFTLEYLRLKFTGNEKEKYLIEQVDFENDNSIILKYGSHNLTCETELAELVKIFGKELEKHFKDNPNGRAVIFHEKADDGIRIEIKDGKLVRFEYWSPC